MWSDKIDKSFNSLMVRLKVKCNDNNMLTGEKFQFLDGAIKRRGYYNYNRPFFVSIP